MRSLLFVCTVLGVLNPGAGPATAKDNDNPELDVVLISGSWEYQSEQTLSAYQEKIESKYPVNCTFLQATARDQLPGLDALDDCDVAVFFTRRLEVDGEALEKIQDYATSGRPVVGVRTASHGFQNWLAMDPKIFGGNYHGHYRNDLTTEVAIATDATEHPILKGVEPYTTKASLYEVQPLADDCQVLLIGTSPEGQEPLAWARTVNGGRVFYTSLGHPADFQRESFRNLLTNAIFWAAGRDVPR